MKYILFFFFCHVACLDAIEYIKIKSDVPDESIKQADKGFTEYKRKLITESELKLRVENVKSSEYKDYFNFYLHMEIEKSDPTDDMLKSLKKSSLIESRIAIGLYLASQGKISEARIYLCSSNSVRSKVYCGRTLLENNIDIDLALLILEELAHEDNFDAIGVLGTYYCSKNDYLICNSYLLRIPESIESIYFQNLGMNYLYGRGLELDLGKAIYYFLKVEQTGHVDAYYSLGITYYEVGERDLSVKYLKKASSFGDYRASYKLGKIFSAHPKNHEEIDKAFFYLKDAEKNGISDAYKIRVMLNISLYLTTKDNKYLIDAKMIAAEVGSKDRDLGLKLEGIIKNSVDALFNNKN